MTGQATGPATNLAATRDCISCMKVNTSLDTRTIPFWLIGRFLPTDWKAFLELLRPEIKVLLLALNVESVKRADFAKKPVSRFNNEDWAAFAMMISRQNAGFKQGLLKQLSYCQGMRTSIPCQMMKAAAETPSRNR